MTFYTEEASDQRCHNEGMEFLFSAASQKKHKDLRGYCPRRPEHQSCEKNFQTDRFTFSGPFKEASLQKPAIHSSLRSHWAIELPDGICWGLTKGGAELWHWADVRSANLGGLKHRGFPTKSAALPHLSRVQMNHRQKETE